MNTELVVAALLAASLFVQMGIALLRRVAPNAADFLAALVPAHFGGMWRALEQAGIDYLERRHPSLRPPPHAPPTTIVPPPPPVPQFEADGDRPSLVDPLGPVEPAPVREKTWET